MCNALICTPPIDIAAWMSVNGASRPPSRQTSLGEPKTLQFYLRYISVELSDWYQDLHSLSPRLAGILSSFPVGNPG